MVLSYKVIETLRLARQSFNWLSLFVTILLNRRNIGGLDGLKKSIRRAIINSKNTPENQRNANEFLKSMMKFLCSSDTINLDTKRFGSMNDGGYELPKRLLVSQALCAGIGKSSEFERHLAEEGIEVIAFDPTVRELPHPHRSIKFVKLWLKGDSASDTQSISILGAFSLLDPDSLKLIKLDIEGDEIDVLDSLSRIQGLERVQILVIEFHNVWEILDKDIRERWGRVIMFLRENFDCVVFNANNWTDFFNVGTLFCPETFEVTLVNKNFPKKTGMGTGKNLKTTNRKDWLGIPNKIFLVNESSD